MKDFELTLDELEMIYAAEPEDDTYDEYDMEDMQQASDYLLSLD